MTLPNFIGIGAPKCGTTWLHELLMRHPEIYMPERRKEINFFNQEQNYVQGLPWYESFFPSAENSENYRAIGEISPHYLEKSSECARRLALIPTINKLIIMLRNPINRTYSQYGHSVRAGYRKSFEEFINDIPYVIDQSLYAQSLAPFLDFYSKEQICCLIFEESFSNTVASKQTIASFLKVSIAGFSDQENIGKVNESYVPKLPWLNYLAGKVNRNLRNKNLDWMIDLAQTCGVKKALQLGSNKTLPAMTKDTRDGLMDKFLPDILKLEEIMDINLDIWRC